MNRLARGSFSRQKQFPNGAWRPRVNNQTKAIRGRNIDSKFVKALKEGALSPIFGRVRKDDTLDLQLRGMSVNVYYRGGSLLQLADIDGQCKLFRPRFDLQYFKHAGVEPELVATLPKPIASAEHAGAWSDAFPALKDIMDRSGQIGYEREFQQRLVLENNDANLGRYSDYFVCDIEYRNREAAQARFDAVAVHWPSDGKHRKVATERRLAFVELKVGDGAMGPGKSANLPKHVRDVDGFVKTEAFTEFVKDTVEAFNSKVDLELVRIGKKLESLDVSRPEIIVLVADHKPANNSFLDDLKAIAEPKHCTLLFARANYFGMCLYDDRMWSLEQMKIEVEADVKRRGRLRRTETRS